MRMQSQRGVVRIPDLHEPTAPAFVVLGAFWLVGALALLANRRWSRPLLVVVSIVSLAYLIFGTVLSLISLAILIFRGSTLYAKPRRRG